MTENNSKINKKKQSKNPLTWKLRGILNSFCQSEEISLSTFTVRLVLQNIWHIIKNKKEFNQPILKRFIEDGDFKILIDNEKYIEVTINLNGKKKPPHLNFKRPEIPIEEEEEIYAEENLRKPILKITKKL